MSRVEGVPSLFIDGTRVRKSPFWEATERYGCRSYDIYNHMYIPGHFADPVEEYWHLVSHVTLWDVAVERCLEVSGPDAHRFAHLLTPRDLDRVRPGQCRYVVLCDDRGGIVNDPVMLRLEEDRYWFALADSDALLWAKGVARCAGMEVEVREADAWPVQVQGPKAKEVLRALCGEGILGLRYYECTRTEVAGIPVVISRTGWSGEVGYEIYLLDADRGVDLWERIMEAGRPFQIRPTGPSDRRRMEAGIYNYGSDMTLEHNPFEVTGLERLVEPKETDYIGKEALERIRREGVRRKLVGIELSGDPLTVDCQDRWPVLRDRQRVGHVTNAVFSPRLAKNIGYAWVPIELSALGTRLEVESPVGTYAAQVVRLPFYDPAKEVPRA